MAKARKTTTKDEPKRRTKRPGGGWVGRVTKRVDGAPVELPGYYFRVKDPLTGKMTQKGSAKWTEKDAGNELFKFLNQNRPNATTGLVERTLSKLSEDYLEVLESRTGKRHRDMVEAQLDKFRVSVGDVPASTVTKSTIESFMARLAKRDGARYTVETGETDNDGKPETEVRARPMSAATMRRYLAAISGLLGFAMDRDIVSVNAARGVKLPRGQEYEPTFLTAEQIRKLYANVSPAIRSLVTFLGETGARLSEGLTLQWHQVAHDSSAVTLMRTKSGKVRTIPSTEAARTLLQELRAKRVAQMHGEDLVFPGPRLNKQGKPAPWSKSRVEKVFREGVKAAGLPERTHLHDLRHSYCSALVQSSVPLSVVMQLAGHSSLVVTNRYAKHAPANLAAQAVAALDRARSVAPAAAAAAG